MARIRIHPQGPTYPWQVHTTPDTNAGIPYAQPWDPPYFGRRTAINAHQTEAFVFDPNNLPVLISGDAWFVPWEPPRFPFGLPVEHHQTEAVCLIPETLPPHVEGMAWWYPFDQPPQRKVKVESQQTTMVVLIAGTLPVGIAGSAWMRGWEPPYFARKTKHYIHQSSPAYGTTHGLPVGIAGMAWYQPFSLPFPKKTAVVQQQTTFHVLRRIGRTMIRAMILGGGR